MINITLPENIKGLSTQEAKSRLETDGYNELPSEKKRRLFRIIIDILKEPMILLLIACITIYIFTGDLRESLVLLISILFIIVITVYQENKTERALEALKSLASPRALVWRDAKLIQIDGRELVRDDVIFLKEGDRVPADGVVVLNKSLNINESLLTGESVPVAKKNGASELLMARPQGDNSPYVYSGTMLVSGQGIIVIKAIGHDTEIGRIGKILDSVEQDKTPLQKNFAQLVEYILIIAIILCLGVFGLNILTAHALIPSILSGITLAMAILPEEFPVVLAIFLSIGAWRLSQHQVLVRKMSVVESLGAATVLCVDKTGTLTMNQMKIAKVYLNNKKELVDLKKLSLVNIKEAKDESLREIIKAGALSSNRHTFDPLEGAIKELRRVIFHEDIYSSLQLIHEYPLSSEFLAMANVWKDGNKNTAYVKGSPEQIMALSSLTETEINEIEIAIKAMAEEGLRILGIASTDTEGSANDLKKIKFRFLGLIAFMDPIRPAAALAIKECYRAGIKVKMITGDYSGTARSIARQIGLENPENVVSGDDFINLSPEKLSEKIKTSSVFARMMPEYKLQIISVLRQSGEVVVMTGDGVNDGPALKAADIGVAMGERGTDVARESAGIVLLDDNFSSLVSGVHEGRKIYDNLQRAVVYLVSVHIPIAALSLLPIILDWPLIFFPAHIMFLELLVDPVCSIVFEAEPAGTGLMSRKPRNSKKSILNLNYLIISLVQGASILLFVFSIYYLSVYYGLEAGKVRALTFSTLVISNILMILVNRSWSDSIFKILAKKNQFLWPIIGAASLFLIFSIYNPFMMDVFSFSSLSLIDWIWPIIFALGPALIFELIKYFSAHKAK
ncbi:MAG: cation-translocating P-type ATPase [Candidatus Falkowbacteria bacterium]